MLYIRDQGDPRHRGKAVKKLEITEVTKEIWNGIQYEVTSAVITEEAK